MRQAAMLQRFLAPRRGAAALALVPALGAGAALAQDAALPDFQTCMDIELAHFEQRLSMHAEVPLEDVAGGQILLLQSRQVGLGDDRLDGALFGQCGIQIALQSEGRAARPVPMAPDEREPVARVSEREDHFRRGQLRVGGIGRGVDRLHPSEIARHLLRRHVGKKVRSLERVLLQSRHLRAYQQEVDVVRVVAELVEVACVR